MSSAKIPASRIFFCPLQVFRADLSADSRFCGCQTVGQLHELPCVKASSNWARYWIASSTPNRRVTYFELITISNFFQGRFITMRERRDPEHQIANRNFCAVSGLISAGDQHQCMLEQHSSPLKGVPGLLLVGFGELFPLLRINRDLQVDELSRCSRA